MVSHECSKYYRFWHVDRQESWKRLVCLKLIAVNLDDVCMCTWEDSAPRIWFKEEKSAAPWAPWFIQAWDGRTSESSLHLAVLLVTFQLTTDSPTLILLKYSWWMIVLRTGKVVFFWGDFWCKRPKVAQLQAMFGLKHQDAKPLALENSYNIFPARNKFRSQASPLPLASEWAKAVYICQTATNMCLVVSFLLHPVHLPICYIKSYHTCERKANTQETCLCHCASAPGRSTWPSRCLRVPPGLQHGVSFDKSRFLLEGPTTHWQHATNMHDSQHWLRASTP